eukprot:530982_1
MEKSFETGMVLISPSLTHTPYLLTIKIHKMRYLADTDQYSPWENLRHIVSRRKKKDEQEKSLDPYIVIEYAGVRVRSDEVYQGTRPEVQLQFEIPVMEPVFTKDIEIHVMDYDLMERNDRIGCVRIDYKGIKDKIYKDEKCKMDRYDIPPTWYYMYGSPIGYTSGHARQMNKGIIEGSHFRGQVLLEICLQRTVTKAAKKVLPINYIQEPEAIDYYLKADLYAGTEISDIKLITTGDIWIEVHASNCKGKLNDENKNDKVSGASYIEWYKTLSSNNSNSKQNLIGPFQIPKKWVDLVNAATIMNNNSEENNNSQVKNREIEKILLPDIFIYLMAKEPITECEQPISYCRVPLRQILGSQSEMWGT